MVNWFGGAIPRIFQENEMPKAKVITPLETPYTDERLGIPGAMLDDDKMQGVEAQFHSKASLEEGVSGRKNIDTEYENFSEADVEAPRSDRAGSPAPIQVNKYDHPHRRY